MLTQPCEPADTRLIPAIGEHVHASESGSSVAAGFAQPESDQHGSGSKTIRTESRITIAGTVREVWDYVCDVGRWPEWAPTVLECWVRGGGHIQPGSRVDQRAKDLGRTHSRSQVVTAVEAPRSVAFAGTMSTSPSRWGMELESADEGRTAAMMWIEVDLAGIMRAVPGLLKGSLQRVSNREMAAIKAAVESATQGGAES
jgi:hypothetical protein